ncbi:ParA family protein [Dyella sp.]|uniref:ParA family protein n=1 Tax=Dyella sp. TaxID=1869338 RepID=UPI002ED20515
MKIGVVNTKGGVGKSTIAVHLAAMLAAQAPTLMIDGDPQGSAVSWAAWRRDASRSPNPTTTVLTGKAVYDEGRHLTPNFSHTVVDAGGRDSASLRGALLLADLAVVPVGASNLDAAAMTDLLEIASLAQDYNRDLRIRVLLMRIDPRTRDTGEMLEYLRENKLDVFDARICERVAYRRAIGEGATVAEIGRDPLAIKEMQELFEEITK